MAKTMDKDGTTLTGTPAREGAIELSGAEMVIRALKDQGVKHIFGYPGGAVLPIYDALFAAEGITHVLVRHEQGAVHAAEGYARSTGKPGVVLVTSGPGATNAVTGLTDALMDSIPLVVLTGQVATHLIGTDAFQEADTVGITRACTKHNWLVKDVNELARVLHEAFQIATTGRPGPVVVDIPKDVQFKKGAYAMPDAIRHRTYRPRTEPELSSIVQAIDLMAKAKKPLFYTGGGIINSGPEASRLLRELVKLTGFPITSTLMGLGAFPASDPQWLGLVGMHGTYEANHAMHDCDVMICLGARFDDRVTGNIALFAPNSKKIHLDIDAAQINKNVRVDVPIVADATKALKEMLHFWKTQKKKVDAHALKVWWSEIDAWRAKKSLDYKNSATVIKPQYAIDRLYELTRGRDVYITTEVGQHQMWAAQRFKFEEPNRWMTSGGLGTMGYGLPAAVGVQMAHPEALVIDIAGEASVQMTMQEMSTAVQYDLPIKIFILNNEYMGMVRQWQQLLHGGRYSHSYSEALPDFVKMAEAYGCVGLRASNPNELDAMILEMINSPKPVLFDCRVDPKENCYPMIPSGAAHNAMILSDAEESTEVSDEGKMLV
jgi:acetolactate synthase-1/2/3 large subunit